VTRAGPGASWRRLALGREDYIHAFDFAKFRVRTIAPQPIARRALSLATANKTLGCLQRSQIKSMPALWRIQGVLVSVQLGDESDHFRLIG